ncbi:MAG: BrnT family toxin [Alphaproteobacteria bacterium]|nr:BrnT family toxin [Alphaproteobacteria bacterium]
MKKISFDPKKRELTLLDRKLDFADCNIVFHSRHLSWIDNRRDYGEERFITVGFLNERMVVVAWTWRNKTRHIISLRKANEREKKKFKNQMD